MSDADSSSPFPSSRSAWHAATTFSAIGFFLSMDVSLTTLLIEPMKRELSLSDLQIGLLQGTAFGLAFGLCSLPLGRVIDRVNRCRLLAVGLAMWMAALAATGLGRDIAALLIARVALGFVAAILIPASFSLIADFFPPGRRARATSSFVVGQAAGQAFGVLAGGKLFDWLSESSTTGRLPFGLSPWRITYCGAAALGVPLVLALLTVREPARHEQGATARSSMEALRELASYAGFLAPLVAGALLIQLTMQASSVWTPTVLLRNFRLMPGQFATWLSITLLLGGLVGAYLAGSLGDWSIHKLGMRRILLPAAGASLAIAPLSCFALMSSIPVFAIMLGLGITAGAIVATLNIVAITLVIPNEIRGLALGIDVFACTAFGTAIAPLAVAWLSAFLGGALHLGGAIALISIPSAVLAAMMFVLSGRALKHIPAR